jgi:hypothetical protein
LHDLAFFCSGILTFFLCFLFILGVWGYSTFRIGFLQHFFRCRNEKVCAARLYQDLCEEQKLQKLSSTPKLKSMKM